MKDKKKCVVILPIHSEHPTQEELISFKQCFDVLHNHDLKVLVPRGLKMDAYTAIVSNFEKIEIDPKWQRSLKMYNKLKLSNFFYDLFSSYDYLLTYELDAFVFQDDLSYWMDKEYDYIGAPWFVGYENPIDNQFLAVGNSGFSLRNIKSMKKAINSIYFKEYDYYKVKRKERFLSYVLLPLNYFLLFIGKNQTIQNAMHLNEDWFISTIIKDHIPSFKIATIDDAVKFSFEVNAKFLYEKNNFTLPTGCHAWQKYEFDFWKPHIESFGHLLK